MTDTETNTVEQQAPEAPDLKGFLKGHADSPSETDIEKWKEQFGEIFTSGFSEEELFIWHPISRADYLELQKKAQLAGQQEGQELDFEGGVVDACLLWASDKSIFERKGGSIPTLSEQILMQSNFMNPAMASMLVMKL